jgi:hypothetical protein
LLLFWLPLAFMLQAGPPEGSITGVVVESRKDEDQQQTLLVEVQGEKDSQADEVHLKLPKKSIKTAAAGFMPEGWKLDYGNGLISMSGKSLNLPLYFRIDLGQVTPPVKTDVEVFHEGKRKFKKKGLIILRKPPVRVSDDFTSVLKFPQVISPGDWLWLKPLDFKKTPASGTWKVGGLEAEYIKDKEYYTVTLPTTLEKDTPISLSYTDPYGVDLYLSPKLGYTRVRFFPEESTANITGVSPMVFVKDMICVCGYFPDDASRNGILVDGRSLGAPVSASNHVLVFKLPDDIGPGTHRISGTAGGGFDRLVMKDFEAIQIRGSIDRNKLMRGESTPLRMWVEGTEKVVTIKLTNNTPNIIRLDGGNEQEIEEGALDDEQVFENLFDDVFRDFSGKQLTKTGPGQWNAEFKMVVNKPTLIFGIREDGRNRPDPGHGLRAENPPFLSAGPRRYGGVRRTAPGPEESRTRNHVETEEPAALYRYH